MKPGSSPLKRASAASARVVDIALRQEHRFGGFAELRTQRAGMHECGLRASSCASFGGHRSCFQTQKNRPRKSQPVHTALRPDGPLATCLTWLQADRPNHHGITLPLDLARACVNRATSLKRLRATYGLGQTTSGLAQDRHSSRSATSRRCSQSGALKSTRAARRRPDPAGEPRSAARRQGLARARQLPARARTRRSPTSSTG